MPSVPSDDKPLLCVSLLGVSVHHLKHVFLEKEVLTCTNQNKAPMLRRSSSTRDIETSLSGFIHQNGTQEVPTGCPMDGKPGAAVAYVNCLSGEDHVGEATHMLSYSKEYTIGDIVDALSEFCSSEEQDPKRTYIWLDFLCVNPHTRVAQPPPAQKAAGELSSDAEFHSEWKSRATTVMGELLVMMAPWQDPLILSEVDCLLELYTAYENGWKIQFIMPPNQMSLMEQDLITTSSTSLEGINQLYERIATTRIENARHSIEMDKKKNLAQIQSTVGYARVNETVQALLRSWLLDVIRKKATIAESREGIQQQQQQDDVDHACSCDRIGAVLSKHGETDAGLQYYQKCMTILESVHGKDNPDIATTYNNVGNLLTSQGDYDGALQYIQKCLQIEESQLGQNHPSTATTLNNLATVLNAKGDKKGALDYLGRCLAIQEAALGKEHPTTAQTHNNLASVLASMGHYDPALHHYQQSMTIMQSVYGNKEHPQTIADLHSSIGNVLKAKGDHDGALQHQKMCLAIQEPILGMNHPDTAQAYSNIAEAQVSKGDFSSALDNFNKCLTIQASVLGEEHPATATTCNCIGDLLHSVGANDAALQMYHLCLAVREIVFGKEHLETAAVHKSIGVVLDSNGEYDGALEHLHKCLVIECKALGESHIQTATTHNKIGGTMRSKGDLDGSLQQFHRSLSIIESVLGKDHPETGTIHNNIGITLHSKGDFDEALQCFQKCLALWEPVVGKEHPNIASTYNWIGLVLKSKGDYHASLEYFKLSFAIQEAVERRKSTIEDSDDATKGAVGASSVTAYNLAAVLGRIPALLITLVSLLLWKFIDLLTCKGVLRKSRRREQGHNQSQPRKKDT